MTDRPTLTFTTVNIGAPDPSALARFYSHLLGWPVSVDEPGWVMIRDPEGAEAGGATLAEFQPQDDVRVMLDPAGHPFCLWH